MLLHTLVSTTSHLMTPRGWGGGVVTLLPFDCVLPIISWRMVGLIGGAAFFSSVYFLSLGRILFHFNIDISRSKSACLIHPPDKGRISRKWLHNIIYLVWITLQNARLHNHASLVIRIKGSKSTYVHMAIAFPRWFNMALFSFLLRPNTINPQSYSYSNEIPRIIIENLIRKPIRVWIQFYCSSLFRIERQL